MRKVFTLVGFIALSYTAFAQYAHQNIDLLSNFDDSTVTAEPVYGIRYQGCWGWRNPADQREYAIIGSTAGTYILDVTNPTNVIQRDYVAGRRNNCIWHEYKSFGKYLYILSDDGGNNSFQIADMSYLPDSVHIVYDDTTLFVHGHAEYIDGNYLYVSIPAGVNGILYSMAVYSLTNPALPSFLRGLNQDYPFISTVHDMYVVNDTVYASCGYQGLFIARYDTSANRFIQLGALPGLSNDYNHSSFLSKDHKTLYVTIEVPSGTPAQIVDVSTISNPTLIDTFTTHYGATPHNPYVLGDYLVLAAYQDGVYTYNLSNPHTPLQSGYFDTHPQNGNIYTSPAYAGCWGAFTDLPSGTLLASDMQLGLFVLDKSAAMGIDELPVSSLLFTVYPNPVHDILNVQLGVTGDEIGQLLIYSADGRLVSKNVFVSSANQKLQINTHGFSPGIYYIKATTEKSSFVRMVNMAK